VSGADNAKTYEWRAACLEAYPNDHHVAGLDYARLGTVLVRSDQEDAIVHVDDGEGRPRERFVEGQVLRVEKVV
jgi:hypothetical protein